MQESWPRASPEDYVELCGICILAAFSCPIDRIQLVFRRSSLVKTPRAPQASAHVISGALRCLISFCKRAWPFRLSSQTRIRFAARQQYVQRQVTTVLALLHFLSPRLRCSVLHTEPVGQCSSVVG